MASRACSLGFETNRSLRTRFTLVPDSPFHQIHPVLRKYSVFSAEGLNLTAARGWIWSVWGAWFRAWRVTWLIDTCDMTCGMTHQEVLSRHESAHIYDFFYSTSNHDDESWSTPMFARTMITVTSHWKRCTFFIMCVPKVLLNTQKSSLTWR